MVLNWLKVFCDFIHLCHSIGHLECKFYKKRDQNYFFPCKIHKTHRFSAPMLWVLEYKIEWVNSISLSLLNATANDVSFPKTYLRGQGYQYYYHYYFPLKLKLGSLPTCKGQSQELGLGLEMSCFENNISLHVHIYNQNLCIFLQRATHFITLIYPSRGFYKVH